MQINDVCLTIIDQPLMNKIRPFPQSGDFVIRLRTLTFPALSRETATVGSRKRRDMTLLR